MISQVVPIAIASAMLMALLTWSLWRVFRPRPSRLDHPFFFFALACLAILALRWPHITFAGQLNPDESQMLAQGMRFLSHPVPWRDVDGTTSGPLNSLLLSLPMYFGAPANWQTARLVLWASICLVLIFIYLTLRCFGTREEAQLAVMPTIFFYGFATHRDFTHYSSETLPVLLLTAGIYLLARGWRAAQPSRARLFALGLIMGAVPFAKLQAAPLALFLLAIEVSRLTVRPLRAHRWDQTWWQDSTLLCVGVMLVPSVIMGVVVAQGAFPDFWTSYILASANYAKEPLIRRLGHTFMLFATHTDLTQFLLDAIAATALGLGVFAVRRATLRADLFWPLLLISADGAATIFCLVVAGKSFLHYLNLMIPVLAIFIGLALLAGGAIRGSRTAMEPARLRPSTRWRFAFCALIFAIQLCKTTIYLGEFGAHVLGRKPSTLSEVARFTRTASQPGDSLSVWGWMPVYYVETGLPPATRDAIGHYIISPGPYQPYFRKRYLADLVQSRPPIFIDAVADGAFLWFWTNAERHETFPELASFIDANYTLCRSIQLEPGTSPVRIYLSKQRAAELSSLRVGGESPANLGPSSH